MALEVFGALSAMIGAVLALVLHGAGVPVAYLANGPFTSFVVPGLVLGIVVGGTQAVAAVLLLMRRQGALCAAAVAGFGMLIWIFVELAVIQHYSWLQGVYFAHGVLELLLVLALLGVAPSVASPM